MQGNASAVTVAAINEAVWSWLVGWLRECLAFTAMMGCVRRF